MSLPRLRPIDAYPVRIDGRTLVCLRDLEGLEEEPVFLTPELFFIASMLDGSADLRDIQAAYARQFGGSLLFSWDIQRLIDELDRHGLLESERLAQRRREAVEAFRAAPVRAAAHAGRAYPAAPDALRAELDRHFKTVERSELDGLAPRGVIAPHIDYGRGAWCYAWAHAALAQSRPETVLILGVAHLPTVSPFVLTAKPYETPLGSLAVDHTLADALAQRIDGLFADEHAHRTEHSIEFQIPFLLHAMGDHPVSGVTVLCSPLGPSAADASPRGMPAVEAFVGAVREYASSGRRLGVLVSVDFSHVGPRFGDQVPVDQALAMRTSAGDRAVLEGILRGEAEAFWEVAAERGNPQRIDALSATYVALRILAPTRGRLLRYGQAPDPAGGIVSFASVALT